tara:strand:+ start:1466 stop:3841 length:2376 start_codon:yes stop_codon:yes gene_type:complete
MISLAIGLSTSITIGLVVYYDLTFDTFHKDSDRIYRITSDIRSPQSTFYNSGVPVPLHQELLENVKGIEQAVYFYNGYVSTVKSATNESLHKDIEDIIFTDENYFQLIQYNWLYGSPSQVLKGPNEIVLTKSRAQKYFPNLPLGQVIGKTLLYNDHISVKVTGIVDNFAQRSDFVFKEFISIKTATSFDDKEQILSTEWGSTNSAVQIFIKTDKKTTINTIASQLDEIAKTQIDVKMAEYNQTQRFHLQPLNDIHFNSNYGIFNSSLRGTVSKSSLIGLSSIALFILLLGCINFINLNTAQATKRAKEIGVQKTLGASKKQVRFQMFGEMAIITFLATMISVVFTGILLGLFRGFIPSEVTFELFKDPFVISFTILLFISVTFLSGFYPTIILSNFKPSAIFRNNTSSSKQSTSLRKYLTVFQFVIAQVFILATLLVGKQINFLMNKDMGFKTNAIAYVYTPYNNNSIDKKNRFIRELEQIPSVGKVSISNNPPASFSTNTKNILYLDSGQEIRTEVQFIYGDTNYLNLYGIDLIAGRERLNDTIQEYIINESYLKVLGFKNAKDAIGKQVQVNKQQVPIVGVMKDFNQRSLKSSVNPLIITGDTHRSSFSQFRSIHFELITQNNDWESTIAKATSEYQKIYPGESLNIRFMDDAISRFYRQEKRVSTLLNWSMGLSIIISCLGLLGLVIHTTQTRTKEIGIRKVLGQKSSQITLLLSKDFMKLISVSIIIGMPIAYFFFSDWVSEFAYRVPITGFYFVLSAIFTFVVALLTISGQTVIASRRNPTETLKE